MWRKIHLLAKNIPLIGLVAAEGERWKHQRKFVLNNLKSIGMVKLGGKRHSLEERILIGVRKAIMDINENIGKPLNTQEVLLNSLGNVINSIVLGKTWGNKDPQWLYLKDLIDKGVKLIGVAGPLNFLPFLRWLPKYKQIIEYLNDGMRRTHKLYDQLYDDKVIDREENANENVDNEADVEEDILMLYKKELEAGTNSYLSRKQMHHVLGDLTGAGIDTTMSTIRWLFLYMAVYPEVQKKVQQELDSVLGERCEPCLDDVATLPYTEACVKEAQRIRSVVPLGIPHGTWSDTELEGYRIPKDTMILPVQWAVHMNPDIWENPEEFNPERFLDDNYKATNKHAHFIPFQNGKRICIGDELARMLLFLFGAGILKVYNIKLGEEYNSKDLSKILDGICGITLEPGEHMLKFTNRSQSRSSFKDTYRAVYY